MDGILQTDIIELNMLISSSIDLPYIKIHERVKTSDVVWDASDGIVV